LNQVARKAKSQRARELRRRLQEPLNQVARKAKSQRARELRRRLQEPAQSRWGLGFWPRTTGESPKPAQQKNHSNPYTLNLKGGTP